MMDWVLVGMAAVALSILVWALRTLAKINLNVAKKTEESASEIKVIESPSKPIEAAKAIARDSPSLTEAKLVEVLSSFKVSVLKDIKKDMDGVPVKVLNTIQGSVNNTSGKMGELMQLLELKNLYDRIIPLSSVADFLCIKFPDGDDPGCVHFVEVKSGKGRLNADQIKFSKIFTQDDPDIKMKTVKTEVS